MSIRALKTQAGVVPRTIAASEFKARCLAILDQIESQGRELVITKRGRPVARLVPARAARPTLRGAGRGLVEIRGDIVHCDWSGEFEALRD